MKEPGHTPVTVPGSEHCFEAKTAMNLIHHSAESAGFDSQGEQLFGIWAEGKMSEACIQWGTGRAVGIKKIHYL